MNGRLVTRFARFDAVMAAAASCGASWAGVLNIEFNVHLRATEKAILGLGAPSAVASRVAQSPMRWAAWSSAPT
jgi:hypothetical protein